MVNIDRQPDPSSTTNQEATNRGQGQAGPRYLSPTALNHFSECPKRYRYAYIERPEVAEIPTPQLVLGNALHRALAYLYRLPVPDRSPEVAAQALRHFWARIEDRDQAFTAIAEEKTWGERALEALDWYCAGYGLEDEPRAVEKWVEAELANGEKIGGRVDRVDDCSVVAPLEGRGGETLNGLEVVDFKTGKVRLEDDDLPGDFGAQVYALATSRVFQQPVLRVRFIYLVERTERRWELELDDLDAVAARLEAATADVRFESEFAARPDFHCRWCRYREICPDRDQARIEQLDPAPATPF